MNGRKKVGLELDGVQELVDRWQGLDHGQGLEVNGRQELEVELDGVRDVEQDVDGVQEVNRGQEVNRRQRRMGNEYAMRGIRFQSRRNTCRHQVYCLERGHMRCM